MKTRYFLPLSSLDLSNVLLIEYSSPAKGKWYFKDGSSKPIRCFLQDMDILVEQMYYQEIPIEEAALLI